jgi:hypothetical protein
VGADRWLLPDGTAKGMDLAEAVQTIEDAVQNRPATIDADATAAQGQPEPSAVVSTRDDRTSLWVVGAVALAAGLLGGLAAVYGVPRWRRR